MANNDKIKKLQDIGITEATKILINIYKSIITYRLKKVNRKQRKVKIYPTLTLPPYHIRVKVYDSLNIPNKHESVELITLPDNYYPTKNTEIKHVINKERYHKVYSMVKHLLQKRIDKGGLYADLNNFEELFNAFGRSSITELYEEYFDEDDDVITGMIYGQALSLSQQIVMQYRIERVKQL